MDNRILAIDQDVYNVPQYIFEALNLLKLFQYKIGAGCRFELFRKRFINLYLRAIEGGEYKLNNNDKELLLFGYKDYWELLHIAASKAILNCSDYNIRTEINGIFKGGLLEGNKESKPWDYQFQYTLCSLFERSGISVELGEPDFLFLHNGKKYSVAAKRLNSSNNIESNIKEAEYQISKTNNYGFIALSLDKIYKDLGVIITVDDPDKSIRHANEVIQRIIRDDFSWKYFGDRGGQILGIIAHISFPYFYKSKKPIFEIGYTAYTMFLPINNLDTAEWNEVIGICNDFHKIDIHTSG